MAEGMPPWLPTGLQTYVVLSAVAAAADIGRRAKDLYAPSGCRSAFSGHSCPEIAGRDAAARCDNTFRKVSSRDGILVPKDILSETFSASVLLNERNGCSLFIHEFVVKQNG